MFGTKGFKKKSRCMATIEVDTEEPVGSKWCLQLFAEMQKSWSIFKASPNDHQIRINDQKGFARYLVEVEENYLL